MVKFYKVMGVLIGFMLLAGCGVMESVPEEQAAQQVTEQPVLDAYRLPARIVPVDMIDALEERDCLITKVVYQEGRRTSKIEIDCGQ